MLEDLHFGLTTIERDHSERRFRIINRMLLNLVNKFKSICQITDDDHITADVADFNVASF